MSFNAKSKFDDVMATKFFMHPWFSGYLNWPRLEKGKGKKRAAGVPAASVATVMDLGDEEGGATQGQGSRARGAHVDFSEHHAGLAGCPRHGQVPQGPPQGHA
jgi:hypothetical protein